MDEPTAQPAERKSSFPATQWSMVLRAGANTGTEAHAALESLCRRYWHPLYLYVRRLGRSHHEAEDCTQAFIAHLLDSNALQRAQPELGRFRTFLLTGLRNFVISDWRHTRTAKRGGGLPPISLDEGAAAAGFARQIADVGLTPEEAFDRAWALSMIEATVRALRAEYGQSRRAVVFEQIAPFTWAPNDSEAHAAAAERLGMSSQTFAVALHRARRRLGDRLRAMVAETVADSADVEAELRYLVQALSGRNSGG